MEDESEDRLKSAGILQSDGRLQLYDEPAPPANFALSGNGSSVLLNNLECQRKTEARASFGTRAHLVRPPESFEYVRLCRYRLGALRGSETEPRQLNKRALASIPPLMHAIPREMSKDDNSGHVNRDVVPGKLPHVRRLSSAENLHCSLYPMLSTE